MAIVGRSSLFEISSWKQFCDLSHYRYASPATPALLLPILP